MGVDGWFLALPDAGGISALDRVSKRLAAGGLSLSEEDAQVLAECRAEALSETGRIEFGESAIVALADAFAHSPVLLQENLARDFSGLLSAFYTLRDELPVDIPDTEIIDALCNCFDECADVEAIASMPTEEVMLFSREYQHAVEAELSAGYRIVDDEGHAYTFNEAEWEYDECANGWEGEEWSDDFGN